MGHQLRKPLVELIEDENIRESLTWLYEYLKETTLLQGELEHFEIELVGTGEEKIPHRLGFTPKDIILTYVTPDTTSVSFKYDQFDAENIVINVDAACTIRFLAGRYANEF